MLEVSALDESVLDKWDKSSMVTSTQVQQADEILNLFDELGNPIMSDETKDALENTGDITMQEMNGEGLNQVGDMVKELESKLLDQTKEVSNLEEKM